MTVDLGTLRLGTLLGAPIVISREEDPRDVWLRKGESALVAPRGLTLVEAVGTTRLRLGHATPA